MCAIIPSTVALGVAATVILMAGLLAYERWQFTGIAPASAVVSEAVR